MKLRDYQEDAIKNLRKSHAAGNRRIGLMLPTGAGKTAIAVEIIRGALEKGQNCLFICDRIELIEQTSRRFDDEGIPHGVVQGTHERWEPHQPLQICSIQTLARRDASRYNPKVIVVDEFHTVFKAQINMMKRWDALTFIGLSATPFTKGLGKYWDDLVVGCTTQELIDQKHLVSPVTYGWAPDLSKVRTVAGEFESKSLGEAMDQSKLVADIVDTWMLRGENRQTICFVTNVAHGEHIAAQFRANGIPAQNISTYSKFDDRKRHLKDFEKGKLRVICSVDILTKGYDNPAASCLIMARPTKSLMTYIQQAGRVLRTSPGKTDAIILDHAGNTIRHGFCTDPLPDFLDDGERKEQKKKEREKPEPRECPSCGFIIPPKTKVCPVCGLEAVVQNKVFEEEGNLVKIAERKARAANEEKVLWFGMLKGYGMEKKFHKGWAYHAFKEKFGVYPTRTRQTPATTPNNDVLDWIRNRGKGKYSVF